MLITSWKFDRNPINSIEGGRNPTTGLQYRRAGHSTTSSPYGTVAGRPIDGSGSTAPRRPLSNFYQVAIPRRTAGTGSESGSTACDTAC